MLLLLSACATQRVQELNSDDIEHLALSVEMCAAAISIHDAALGQQGGLRRRVARKILGRVKTLAGNQLFVRAITLMTQVSSGSEHLSELLSIFSDVLHAQQSAQNWKQRIPSPDELLSHHAHHSTLLFSFVCRAGARVAGADRKSIGALGRYGAHVGMAWLIAEELLWLLDEQEHAIQLLRAQANHNEPPYILSLMYEDEELQKLWGELCISNDKTVAKNLYTRFCTISAFQRARQTVVEYAFKAESSVRVLDPSPHRDALISLIQNLLVEIKERIEEHKINSLK
jgi:geranylgeranyl pyrophosphate synthase